MNPSFQDRRNILMIFSALVPNLLVLRPATAAAAKERIKKLLAGIESDRLRDSRPCRAPHLCWQEQDESVVLLRKGKAIPLYRLNPTAKTIWENCNGRRTLAEISQKVCRKYQVSSRQAYVDVLFFLTRLNAIGAITF